MGISKRNPRGNFNWQSRYLKRKAINCGQLDDMPFDCSIPELQPVVAFGASVACITTPPTLVTICNGANFAPNQTSGNTYTLYKDGVVVDVAYGGPSYAYTVLATPSFAGEYQLEVTNRFGCTAISTVKTLELYYTPIIELSSSIGSTIPCSPPAPPDPPFPGGGNGEITITMTNFVPGYPYEWVFTYDLGPPFGIVDVITPATSASITFTTLCNFRYNVYVRMFEPTIGYFCSSNVLSINLA